MRTDYDLIVVGGGLGGAALAKAMAERGACVLVIEREPQFRDRVRGEGIFPWGVIELRTLGLYQQLIEGCAQEVRWIEMYVDGTRIERRDLQATNRQPMLNWVHNEMEEVLLQTATTAGAEVRRGVRACGVKPGARPAVSIELQGKVEEIPARLVVCADGRGSVARKWANFAVQQDSYGMLLAGILVEGMPDVSSNTNYWFLNPTLGQFAFLCPQSNGRTRAYAWHPRYWDYRFQGAEDLPHFVADSVKAGAPSRWYASVRPIGPLATFDGADTWVVHPYNSGVVLIGDAAASSDPSYGQGQGLTARDARVLRDQLLANDDWDVAGHTYAAEHDRYFAEVHKFTSWVYKLLYETGPEADARRTRALPLLAEDMSRMPDAIFTGPEVPLDETARKRFFGEE
jgi:2-polyprenyl-6-methoxyphenol hydroxylase-like FAD-dependent oxidoreductase